MSLKFNPLLRGGFDESKRILNDLEDVNTAGTVDGYVLAWEQSSGTWKPSAAGAGDMLKSDYDQLDDGVVDNSERLEGETLGSVQAHTVDAINVLGTLTDANIPDVETLSYGVAFADGQIPTLDASKIISGTIDATQIPDLPTSRIATGTFIADRIPTIENLKGTVPDSKIPDMDTLSYGAAFAGAQIPNLPTTKITSGTFNADRIPTLPNLKGTVTDAKIPNLETLSYGGAFAEAQIPNLAASKITSGTFNVNRIETLDNLKGTVTAAKVAVLDADKITTGTFGLARVPAMDDAHIPDLETLSYGGTFADAQIPNAELLSYGAAFGTAQIPSIGAYKVTSGTLNADRVPALPTARITTGTFNADRIPILPTDRYGSAVLLTGAQTIGGTKTFSDIPILPASNPTADNEAARKAYVDQTAVKFYPYIGDETQLETVSGTYEQIKSFRFVKHGSVVSPGTIRIACELKTTAGSYQMQIIVGGGTAITFSGTESAYKLRYGDYGLDGVAVGVVETRAKFRNIGAGTSYNRLYDAYLKY